MPKEPLTKPGEFALIAEVGQDLPGCTAFRSFTYSTEAKMIPFMYAQAKTFLSAQLPRVARFAGSSCSMLAVGAPMRQVSFATILCGDDVRLQDRRRIPRTSIDRLCLEAAAGGGVAVVAPHVAPGMGRSLRAAAIELPPLVDLRRRLPASLGDLHDSLRTSTTREDLRRIRKAGFTYRIEKAPDLLREFHGRYAAALLEKRFPDEGRQDPLEADLKRLREGGELVCLDSRNDWLAGIFNSVRGNTYELGGLGIRDGREDIRRMHVTSALLVRSFERGVELGLDYATLGRSIPFLGKGPIWFKAKWGGVLHLDVARPRLKMLLDVRHETVRHILARHPIVHCDGNALAVAFWLDRGPDHLRTMLADRGRFPGISRWYVLGNPDTIAEGRDAMATAGGIVPVPVPQDSAEPLWLAEVLRRGLREGGPAGAGTPARRTATAGS
jgi:hypothetical protein